MQRFAKKIVDMMKEENLFSWQGGPIILTQVKITLRIVILFFIYAFIFICIFLYLGNQ